MKHELDIYIRARYPLLWVVTPEEERALAEIQALADTQHKRLMTWSITQGVVMFRSARRDREAGGEARGWDFTLQAAKYLANAMAYDDVTRVADLKTRGTRFERIRKDVRAADGQR